MQDDGFDRRIIGKFFQFADHWLWREDHSVKINHSNTVAEAAKPRFIVVRVQREVDQREHRQNEEEESSSANQYPEKGAGTLLSHWESLAPHGSFQFLVSGSHFPVSL